VDRGGMRQLTDRTWTLVGGLSQAGGGEPTVTSGQAEVRRRGLLGGAPIHIASSSDLSVVAPYKHLGSHVSRIACTFH
jgi:hypothetical protein